MWIDLGATSEALGYDISFVLGDGERWYQLGMGLLEELPQPLKGATISAYPTAHTIPSFAWKISNSDRLGKFDRERAAGLPLETRTKLANGEDVQHDGETLLAEDYRDEPRLGHSIIVSGDTAERSIDTNCDLLIHEATFLETHAALADDHLHSTAAGAARTAVACEATHLALTHYSGRLEDHTLSLDEARPIHASVVACGDGDRLRLEEDGSLTHMVRTENGWLTS
jgi:ribonuclease Z